MKALVTGIVGQDGSYLTEQLLRDGYEVHGMVRRSSRGYGALENIAHLVADESVYRRRLFLHSGDLSDGTSVARLVAEIQPDELYNLGAQADVMESNFMPEYTIDVNGNGVVRVLEAIRRFSPKTRMYQASTSELFGRVEETPQHEGTRMMPQSPYAIGKLAGYHAVRLYREAYGIFAVNGITFNHTSPRRTDDYVCRKITKAAARIKLGLQKELRLGNLEAKRDWSLAPEVVEAFRSMLRMDQPQDLVLGSGTTCTVREWLEAAFAAASLDPYKYVVDDPKLHRPAEVDVLLADPGKASAVIGWKATTSWRDIVALMVASDIERYEKVSA